MEGLTKYKFFIMKKETIKSHLLIKNKLLGTLLYFKDKKGRGCLKLSFKNKIANFSKGTDIPTSKPVPTKLKNSMRFDVSYKFQDSLLEVKKIINGKIEREFYKISIPILTYLFVLEIKDWRSLDDIDYLNQSLVLDPPSRVNNVAIIFSFLDSNNKPIAPKDYSCLMGMINLPERGLNKLCIGISEGREVFGTNDFILKLPFLINQNSDSKII